MATIFEEILMLGIEYSNHESDLYIPITEDTTKILKQSGYNNPLRLSFINQLDGTWWYDVPFAYDPFWQKRGIVRK